MNFANSIWSIITGQPSYDQIKKRDIQTPSSSSRDLEKGSDENKDGLENKTNHLPRYKAIIYEHRISDEVLFRKKLVENFSEPFLKDLEIVPDALIRSTQEHNSRANYWMLESFLISRNVYPPFSSSYIHPLFNIVNGTVTHELTSISIGGEDIFGSKEIAEIFPKDEHDSIYLVDFIITSIQCNKDATIELCICDSEKTYGWTGWQMIQVESNVVDLDKTKEEKKIPEIDPNTMMFVGSGFYPSLIYGSNMGCKKPTVKNNMWNLYLGDKDFRQILDLFHFLPSDQNTATPKQIHHNKTSNNNKMPDCSEEERWTYIEKNFNTFLILLSIKDSLMEEEYFPNLKNAIERCLLKSIGVYYRIEEKYAKTIMGIISHNLGKTEKTTLNFKIRAFDYAMKRATYNSISSDISLIPLKITIGYQIVYRKVNTEAVLQTFSKQLEQNLKDLKEQKNEDNAES